MSKDLKTQLRGFAQELSQDLPIVEHHTPEFRNHAWHWGTVINSRTRPRAVKRFPLWRDMLIATMSGVLLGASLTFTLRRGFFPPAGAIGLFTLLVHVVALGLGQFVDEARLSRWDIRRIASVGVGAFLLSALAALVLMA